jgi:hypothetical protein
MGSDAPELSGEFPAEVAIRALQDEERAALLETYRQRAPAAADTDEPFFWSAEISNGRMDSYYTHMLPSSLKNYAADCEAGIPFMNNHRTGGGLFAPKPTELPMGRSIGGRFHAGQRTGEPRTEAVFYTMRGLKLGEVNTDDFIRGVETGIVRDVSIGFMGGNYVCDVCGEDMLRSEKCEHFPGMEYEKTEGKKKTRVKATAGVDDAHCGEVSAVFRGATPGAMILKATRMAEAGLFSRSQAAFVSDRYQVALPGGPQWYVMPGAGTTGGSATVTFTDRTTPTEGAMGERNGTVETTDDERTEVDALRVQLTQIRAALALEGGADVLTHVQQQRERLQTVEAEVERLKPLAADGEAWRASLITEAITQGKRAFGDKFNEDRYKAILSGADVEAIRDMRDNFKTAADQLFPEARVTKEPTEEPGSGDEETPRRRPAARQRHSV